MRSWGLAASGLIKTFGDVLGYLHKASDALRVNAALGMQKNFDDEYTAFARANGLDGGRFGINRRRFRRIFLKETTNKLQHIGQIKNIRRSRKTYTPITLSTRGKKPVCRLAR